tara:strand:+ start:420 stop:761 length:342 start_codon:yes stop_codon:yes gene_type:complete
MATLYTKIKLYLEANGKTEAEFDDRGLKIELRNNSDGSGDFIETWNVSGLAEPTAEQLATYNTAGDTYESNFEVRRTRRKSYGDMGDQLDEIFKDIDAWKSRIQSIKNSNPKS